MVRILLALCVIASFNIIAIQLFMAGHAGPLASYFPFQQALLITAFFIILADIMIIYTMLTIGKARAVTRDDFDRLFRKYYNGKNFEEAFERAGREWKRRR